MAWHSWITRRFSRRQQRRYAGASIQRTTSSWITSGTNADSEKRSSVQALRNRARQLCRDSDYARQALRTISNNVVGTGIQFQSQVRMARGAGRLDQRINDTIEAAWHEWCSGENCDVGGRLSFHDIERLVIRSCAESGEVIIRLVIQQFGYSKVPLGLEIIEADVLVDDYNGTAANGNEIRMGIELDRWRRPTAYYFYSDFKHPGDFLFNTATSSSRYIRIPANEIIHLYIVDRPGQSRGVTWFASAIERLHHLDGYEKAEVINARATASLMGFIQSPEGELVGDDVYEGERVTTFEPGVFKYLAPGESVTVPPINKDRNASSFSDFLRTMLRAVAAGIGCSYEGISADYSQSNYSSSRLALLNERDTWRQLQSWMIDNFNKRIYYRWLDLAVMSGVLPLSRYELDPNFYRACRFIPRSWSWVDPQKEIVALKEAERAGYTTKSQIIAEAGGDLHEILHQRQLELQLASELGLAFDTDVPEPQAPQTQPATQPRPQTAIVLDEEDEEDDIEDDIEDDDIEEDDELRYFVRVPEKYEHINFRAPNGARAEAARGLEWRSEFGRGGTAVGVARARDIKNGVELSVDTIGRMNSYFARHEVDKQATGFRPGEDGYPSNGRIAWALWGGDAGQRWAKRVARQIEVADQEEE